MATTDVLAPVNSLNTPSWKTKAGPGDATPLKLSKDVFDAKKHLNMDAAPKVRTMKELGFANMGISPVAVSEPFPLFNEEAIMRMREEVLSPAVVANYSYSSNISHGHAQLRGYASKAAPFVYDAWKDPETLKVISRIAGVDLVTQLDFEIGHVNLSYKSEEAKTEELRAYHTRKRQHSDSDKEDIIVDWHCDSYPFVCVLMLSDCTNMVGGETALRTGSGEVVKVRGPQMGCAVVLQGRYIEHKALAALGATERITMVTSFRPRSTKIPDETVLTTVRGISNLTELYSQFCEYRLEIVEERIREQLKEIRAARAAGRDGLKTKCLKTFIKEQENFLAYTAKQMVDDEKVIKGTIEDGRPGVKHKKRAR